MQTTELSLAPPKEPRERVPRHVHIVANPAADPSIVHDFALAAARWQEAVRKTCPFSYTFEVGPTSPLGTDGPPPVNTIEVGQEGEKPDGVGHSHYWGETRSGRAESLDLTRRGFAPIIQEKVTAHELGHALGLEHDDRDVAVMNRTAGASFPTSLDVEDFTATWCPGAMLSDEHARGAPP